MKHYFVILLFFLLNVSGSSTINAQTNNCRKIPPTEKYALYALSFPTSDTGWTCGNNGRILNTKDGGKNWTLQRKQEKQSLNDIDFVNTNLGFVVGFDWRNWQGIVLRTSDGGKHWQTVYRKKNWVPNAVKVTSSKECWIAGEQDIVLQTKNTGKSWQEIKVGNSQTCFETLCFVNKNQGWLGGSEIISDGQNSGVLFKTLDGGKTWQKIFLKQASWVQSVKFLIPDIGFAVGWLDNENSEKKEAVIFRTDDGGAHWARISKGVNGRLCGIDFYDAHSGMAVGYDYNKSRCIFCNIANGEGTPYLLSTCVNTIFYDLAFSSGHCAWLAGGDGLYKILLNKKVVLKNYKKFGI